MWSTQHLRSVVNCCNVSCLSLICCATLLALKQDRAAAVFALLSFCLSRLNSHGGPTSAASTAQHQQNYWLANDCILRRLTSAGYLPGSAVCSYCSEKHCRLWEMDRRTEKNWNFLMGLPVNKPFPLEHPVSVLRESLMPSWWLMVLFYSSCHMERLRVSLESLPSILWLP